MAKKKNKHSEEKTGSLPWFKTAGALFTLIPLGTIVACLGLIHAYKTTGANELRIQVYQPLYADILNVEQSIQAVSTEAPVFMKAFNELRGSGAFQQTPLDLQRHIVKMSEDVSTIQLAITAVRDIALREMSVRILKIRNEQKDRAWRNKAESVLREMSQSKAGFSDTATLFSKMNHEARSRSVDVSKPNQPEIAGPGGPTFVVRDWLTYPDSIKVIEDLWTDVDYLYFNDRLDSWYYQITKEDLRQQNTNLEDFLKPVFSTLNQNSDFQLLLRNRPAILVQLREIKAELEARILDPKQLGDLVPF
jgi:hypothetical protein